ncbi:MAG: site-2 protease family protein [Coriobacteriaceae bacterium]
MDILIMIVCAVISIGFLVFIHEGGHYLAARAFGVRVTEFMLARPASIGFTKADPLWRHGRASGGYAKVCGMEAGPLQPHLQAPSLYRRGIITWKTWPATAASATMKHTTPWKSWWNGAASSVPPRPISTTPTALRASRPPSAL